MVHPYNSIDIATAWKKSNYILLDRSDFYFINNLSIAVHVFARCMMTSLSVDEILLPKYVNVSINFRNLPLNVEVDFSHLKPMNSVLCSHRDQCLLLLDQSYVVGIQFGQVYLQKALDHLHSLSLCV